ncbi:MAG TPA: caspase family protein [Longimicrobium sp.]|nr:caspase family protein [Longimicrobium sp.]
MPNSEDFALVIGIDDYKALDGLDGAKNDAEAFVRWLRDPAGGDVPGENIKLFLSSSDPWAPTMEPIIEWLAELVEARSPGQDDYVGRRLYLFMAGHGIGPSVDEAGLLMSNTSAISVNYMPGSKYANLFRQAALFEDVVLFMDCCRDHDWDLPDANIPLRFKSDPAAAHKVNILYAFATGFGRKSRERAFGENGSGVGGVFTRALLDGLACKAATPDGRITSESLKRYVLRQVEALRVPGTDQRPDVRVNFDFVLREGCPPPRVQVTVELTEPERGFMVLDAGAGMKPVEDAPRGAGGNLRVLDLIPGHIYVFRVMDDGRILRETGIEVKDEGANHVRL